MQAIERDMSSFGLSEYRVQKAHYHPCRLVRMNRVREQVIGLRDSGEPARLLGCSEYPLTLSDGDDSIASTVNHEDRAAK